MHITTRHVLAAALAGTLIMPALAHAQSSGWQERDLSLDRNGLILGDSETGKEDSRIEGIYSHDGETGIMFLCQNGELGVTIASKDYDFTGDLEESRRKRKYDVSVYLDEEEATTTKWYYLPTSGLLRSGDFSTKAKLFNAVIKGETLTLKSDKLDDDVVVDLPPVDDTFRSFARDCGF